MANRTIKIDVIVDEQGAVQKLRAVDEAADKVTENATGAAGGVGALNKELGATRQSGGTATSVFASLTSAVQKFAGPVGIIAALYEIKKFITGLFDTADALTKLSAKTAIGIEQLQRLEYAAKQNGNELTELTGAISQMQNRLASGDKSALAALKAIGLSFEYLSRLKPDQQFIEIAYGIAKVPDPMKRVQLAMDLFGRSGAEILPTITSDIETLGEKASVMSEDTVKGFDDLGDSFGNLIKAGKNLLGTVLSPLVPLLNGIAKALEFVWGWAAKLYTTFYDYVKLKPLVEWIQVLRGQLDTPQMKEAPKALMEIPKFGMDSADAIELLDKEMSKAIPKAESHAKALDKVDEAQKKVLTSSTPMLANFSTATYVLPIATQKSYDLAIAVNEVVEGLGNVTDELYQQAPLVAEVPPKIDAASESTNQWRDRLGALSDILGTIANTSGNGFLGFLASVVGGIETANQQAMQFAASFEKLGMDNKWAKYAGIGVAALGAGYGAGSTIGGKKSIAIGVASGAATGAQVGGWWGAAVGAIAGGIGAWWGNKKKAKEEKAEMQDLQNQLLQTYGTMQNLRDVATSVGINIDKAFNAKKPSEALAVIKEFNQALDAKRQRLEGLTTAMDILNTMTITNEESAQRFGDRVLAVASGMIKETGDVINTIRDMGPALDLVKAKYTEYGLEGSDALNKLLGMKEIITVHKDIADRIQQNTALMKAFGDANLMTKDIAKGFAQDVIADYIELRERQVGSTEAMTLMQPELQKLWELQKKFGMVTDEATLALLKEAEQSGIVGENMKSVNEQILDVLLDIKDIFANGIPGAVRQTRDAFDDAAAAARRVRDEANGIRGGNTPDITEAHFGGLATAGGIQRLHSGGNVLPFIPRRLHRGGLASDEVPAILQTGEGVLSRRGMRTLGRLNQGIAGGSGGKTVVINVDARGSIFEDDRALGRLSDRISKKFADKYGQGVKTQVA